MDKRRWTAKQAHKPNKQINQLMRQGVEFVEALGDRSDEILELSAFVSGLNKVFYDKCGRGAIALLEDDIVYFTLGRPHRKFWDNLQRSFPEIQKEIRAIMSAVIEYNPALEFVGIHLYRENNGTRIKMGHFTSVLIDLDTVQIDENAVDFVKQARKNHLQKAEKFLMKLGSES